MPESTGGENHDPTAAGGADTVWEPILVVDDEPAITSLLARVLRREGYAVTTASNGDEALAHLECACFAVLLTDISMPGMRGTDLQKQARLLDPDIAVLLVTAVEDVSLAVACMRDGAYDYVSKPFDIADVTLRVRRAVEKRRMSIELRQYREGLEQAVAERTAELRQQFLGALDALCSALEAKDSYTLEHSARVSRLAAALAERLYPGDLPLRETVEIAGRLHDIGKIGIPEAIIGKSDSLSDDEYALIQRHPQLSSGILRPLIRNPDVLATVRHHHERWDGSGYPDGLAGEAIPLGARVLAVADAFDAMTSCRPYRAAMCPRDALAILQTGAGANWDPFVVDALVEHLGVQ